MHLSALLPFIGLSCALPSLLPRQNNTIDYGYWEAEYTSEGFAAGTTENVKATYSNPGHESNITVSCRVTTYRGQTTRTCDPGFSYTWGAPYLPFPQTGGTLSLSQKVDLGGEEVTVHGSALLQIQHGLGGGRASRAAGRVEAGIVQSS